MATFTANELVLQAKERLNYFAIVTLEEKRLFRTNMIIQET